MNEYEAQHHPEYCDAVPIKVNRVLTVAVTRSV